MDKFIHFDECQDVLASLEQCAIGLTQVRRSGRAWKWVVISLHSALQGAMVCHLSGTIQLGALTEKSSKEMLDWYEKDRRGEIKYLQDGEDEFGAPKMRTEYKTGNPPIGKVAGAATLLERLGCSEKRLEGGCGGVISITEQQKSSFNRLHHLRNEFTHFRPKGWIIEIGGIEEIIFDILGVLRLIADDYWPFRDMSDEDKKDIYSSMEEIENLVATQG